jgi:isoquinoline 1-oxidoreductase subunit beta
MSAPSSPWPTPAVAPRRRFLKAGLGGLTVAILPTLSACALPQLPVIPKRPQPEAAHALGWLHHADGITTLVVPRVEMGQNIATALKQIVCLEMGVPWHTVQTRLHSSANLARVKATVGSDSIKDFALPLAQACATLRDALRSGVLHGQLKVQARPTSELRSFAASALNANAKVPPLPPPPLEQGQAIVRGQALYVADVRLPGMVFGRVLRAPLSPELSSTLSTMNTAAAQAVPGFVALVQSPLLALGNSSGVGIVARTPGALDRVEAALAPQWHSTEQFDQNSLDAAIDVDLRLASKTRLKHAVHSDNITPGGPWDVNLRLDIPLAAHAPLEPRAAVAAFDPQGLLQLWVGSQDVFYQRDVVAKRLGLQEDQVQVHGQRVGGAFGGKTICTVELEAAVLARHTNLPVKVQWSRAQEFQLGFARPPSSHRIRARLKDGKLQDWSHSFASSHILFTAAVLPAWLQKLTGFVGDDGVARGATLPYRARARCTTFDLVRLAVHTGPWRGLGAGPNVFAIETAMDRLAKKAGMDPVAFRLAHLDDPRLAGVLQTVAQAAQWGRAVQSTATPGSKPSKRRGRGVACGIYKAMSYVAVVADVEVDTSSGQVQVTHLWCAHDCGQVFNPDQVRAQCEGNLVWGLGMALLERLPVAQSRVAAGSFAQAPIPRFADVPEMTVLLVNSTQPPTGAGETGIVATAAAIGNALSNALDAEPGPQADAVRLPLKVQAVAA